LDSQPKLWGFRKANIKNIINQLKLGIMNIYINSESVKVINYWDSKLHTIVWNLVTNIIIVLIVELIKNWF
jgi:hypothetical protein